jgi:hypothetical protein
MAYEIIAKRSLTRKVFDIENGQKLYRFHIAHKHYKDINGDFQDIDPRLTFDTITKVYKHNKASYSCKIPEYSDGWFSFQTQYEGQDFTLLARPIIDHILGTYHEDNDGKYVLYSNAFGQDIDLKVYSYWAGIKKVICINKVPTSLIHDLNFDFEMSLPPGTVVKDVLSGIDWNIQNTLDFSGKVITLGNTNGLVYFRNARVWDNDNLNESVKIILYKQGNKVYLRKTITADILQKSTFPLYTDHPTSYYVGAGDGLVYASWYSGVSAQVAWDTAHDKTTGTAVNGIEIIGPRSSNTGLAPYFWTPYIYRTFCPIDTSGIDNGVTITSAIFNAYVSDIKDWDNDANDYAVIVQTSQVDPTTLVNDDYDNIGITEGSNQGDLTNLTLNQYNQFTLNATGISWIDKINSNGTLLGFREGHDLNDDLILYGEDINNNQNSMTFAASEDTSGTKDPYLDVTVSASENIGLLLANINVK